MTRQQQVLLSFVEEYTKANGYAPSYAEMTVALGLKSKSGIHRIVMSLTEQGFLSRRPGRRFARSISIVPPAALAIPPGFVLVPKVPTLEMREHGAANDISIIHVWNAMLAAAPKPPGAGSAA